MRRHFGWLLFAAVVSLGCTSSGEVADPSEQTVSSTEPAAPSQPATATVEPPPHLPAPVLSAEPVETVSPLESLGRVGSVMVWTGDEIIVWGGTHAYGSAAVGRQFPGVAFDPENETWRELTPAPGRSQSEAVGFWTGEEVVICCGRAGMSAAPSTLLYNPTADAWRSLPPPPFTSSIVGASAALTGDLLYVVGPEQLLVLDLTTEQWSERTPPPARVTFSPGPSFIPISNGDLVLWPRPGSRNVARGLSYNAARDEWEKLPAPPAQAWPANADLAWTGEELMIVGGLPGVSGPPEQLVGARLDWRTMSWRALPDVWPQPVPSEGNLGSQSIAWTGDRLVVVAGALGSGFDPLDSAAASYHPAGDQWFLLSVNPGVQGWHRPLLTFGSRVVFQASTELFISEAGWASDEASPVPADGLPAAPRAKFDDLVPRTDTPLTIVGSTGNGASIVVIDLDLGLRTIYSSAQHSLGSGPLTDMTLVDRDLYVWRRNEPVLRFDGGPGPWDGRGERLTFGELSQPAVSVGEAGGDRFVLPVPTLNASWVWGDFNGRRQARLVPFDGSPALVTAEFDERLTQFGRSGDGTMVLSDHEQTTIALQPNGVSIKLGAGAPLAIAGSEVLMQRCDGASCIRRWVDLQTAAERGRTEDEWRWVSVAGPSIPGHSPRLDAASANGEQILIGRRLVATPTVEYGYKDLVRVEVATGVMAPLSLHDGRTGLAVWSRSGEHVVTFGASGDIIVVDIDSNKVTTIKGAMPDGFFPLAAG